MRYLFLTMLLGVFSFFVLEGNAQSNVGETKMAKHRKSMSGCPDIFAPPQVEAAPVIETAQPQIEIKPEIKQPERKPFFLPDPVFFRINKWAIDAPEWQKIDLAVNYLRENPTSTCVVTGYADKKTGNQTINLRLSKLRSEAVAEALVNKYGIAPSRISINWKGDGLQPFQLENDKNRAVLFLINP
ncbi:MAG: OmpA family protein [Prevotella sp.]|jgi:outer membrane protein OmpA-like peptidoglycan-associated protein|nr:OmpA family protein [Prevotella sp.]